MERRQKFDIKFRKDIESEKLKVETKLGNTVKIYSWDGGIKEYPIVASVSGLAHNYSNFGEIFYNQHVKNEIADPHCLDLYVVSLPVITNFEKSVMDVISHAMDKDYNYPIGDGKFEESNYKDIKEVANILQEGAIDDFIKITTAYSNIPVLKHDTHGGEEYVHYMNFCFYPRKLQELEWIKKKYFPGLLEN